MPTWARTTTSFLLSLQYDESPRPTAANVALLPEVFAGCDVSGINVTAVDVAACIGSSPPLKTCNTYTVRCSGHSVARCRGKLLNTATTALIDKRGRAEHCHGASSRDGDKWGAAYCIPGLVLGLLLPLQPPPIPLGIAGGPGITANIINTTTEAHSAEPIRSSSTNFYVSAPILNGLRRRSGTSDRELESESSQRYRLLHGGAGVLRGKYLWQCSTIVPMPAGTPAV